MDTSRAHLPPKPETFTLKPDLAKLIAASSRKILHYVRDIRCKTALSKQLVSHHGGHKMCANDHKPNWPINFTNHFGVLIKKMIQCASRMSLVTL